MSILSLLQLALSLLISVQAPSVSVELRQQALNTAKQIVQIASSQISLMNTQPNNTQATSTQETQPQNPAQPQASSTPIVTQNQQPSEPVLGSAENISAPSFQVTITKVTTSTNGGEFFFTIQGKTGTPQHPELILDEVSTNLRPGQTFFKLPPIEGTTNNYRMGISLPQANYPQNPSISIKIGDETVEQNISIQ